MSQGAKNPGGQSNSGTVRMVPRAPMPQNDPSYGDSGAAH